MDKHIDIFIGSYELAGVLLVMISDLIQAFLHGLFYRKTFQGTIHKMMLLF
jgi:hypothetical protein